MKLSRTTTGLLAVALMSFMVSDVMAQGQRPGGGQPGGGRGGPGGFGQRGGPGGGGFGGRGGPGGGGSGPETIVGLLQVDEVKVEVELSPDQDEAVGKLRQPGERPDFRNFREMSDAERTAAMAKFQKAREERSKKMQEQLEEVLLPQQMDRLKQIALQLRGMRALREEEVVKELKITAAQTKEIEGVEEKLREENGPKIRDLYASGDREAMGEAITKMRVESEKQVLAVLTSDQRKQFGEMKGEKFDMPAGAMFGGGRGGPGGGFGGRGGPGGGRGGDGERGGDGGRRRGRPPVEE